MDKDSPFAHREEKDKLCPACINRFLEGNGIEDLADEIFEMNHPGAEHSIEIKLCADHTDLDLGKEAHKARKATKPAYDKFMAESSTTRLPNRPSQRSE